MPSIETSSTSSSDSSSPSSVGSPSGAAASVDCGSPNVSSGSDTISGIVGNLLSLVREFRRGYNTECQIAKLLVLTIVLVGGLVTGDGRGDLQLREFVRAAQRVGTAAPESVRKA